MKAAKVVYPSVFRGKLYNVGRSPIVDLIHTKTATHDKIQMRTYVAVLMYILPAAIKTRVKGAFHKPLLSLVQRYEPVKIP
ncbi:hypothetical protein D3C87_1765660 [compost metagenome]